MGGDVGEAHDLHNDSSMFPHVFPEDGLLDYINQTEHQDARECV